MLGNTIRNTCGRSTSWTINGPTWDWGRTSRAWTFDGTNDSIDFNQSVISGYPCTILVEFKTTNSTAADRCFFSQSNSLSTAKLGLRLNASHQVEAFVNANEIAFATAANDGKWHVAAFVANAAGTVTVSLDGVFGSTVAGGTFPAVDRSTLGAVRSTSTTEYFPGTIARVLVYSRALSVTEVQRRMRYFATGQLDSRRHLAHLLHHEKVIALGQASSTETALAVVQPKFIVPGIAQETDSAMAILRAVPEEGVIQRIYSWDMGTNGEFRSIFGTGISVQNALVHSTLGGYALRTTSDATNNGFVVSGIIGANGALANGGYNQPFLRIWFGVLVRPATTRSCIHFATLPGPGITFGLNLNSTGTLSVYTGGSTLVATGTTVLANNTWYEIKIKAHSGAWEVRLTEEGGTEILEMFGSHTFTDTAISPLFGITNSGEACDFLFDDGALSTGGYPPTGESTFLRANAAGAYQTWTRGGEDTGENYLQVASVPHDGDTTYLLSTNSVGDAETESIDPMPPNRIPNAVQAVMIARRDGSGPGIFMRVRSGSTNSDNSVETVGGLSYAAYLKHLATDPATSAPWTANGVNGIEVGGVENQTAKTRVTLFGAVVDYKLVEDKFLTLGLASTTDEALTVVPIQGTIIGVAQTEDSSSALVTTIERAYELGQPSEVDIGLAIAAVDKVMAIGLSEETDEALEISRPPHVVELQQAFELDDAIPVLASRDYAVGIASEEDTALAVAPSWNRVVELATETDTADVILAEKAVVLGPPIIEQDTALAFGSELLLQFAQASEEDTALPMDRIHTLTFGQTSESDTALPIDHAKTLIAGLAEESDTALDVTRIKTLQFGQPSETDTAHTFTLVRAYEFGIATETDTAHPMQVIYGMVIGLAEETDSALTISPEGVRIFGMAEETDSALTVAVTVGKPVGQATETDTALDLTKVYIPIMGQALESDEALVLTPQRTYAFGVATETDTAHTLTMDRAYVPGIASETDTAQTIVHSYGTTIGIAEDTSEAIPIAADRAYALGLPIETDTALPVNRSFLTPFNLTTETDSVQAVSIIRAFEIQQALELDESLHIAASYSIPVRQAETIDTALAMLEVKSHVLGIAEEHDTAFSFLVIGARSIGIDFFSSNIDARPRTRLCLLVGREEHLRFEFTEQLLGGLLAGDPLVQEVVNGKPTSDGEPGTVLTITNVHRNNQEYTAFADLSVMLNQAVVAHVTVKKQSRDPVILRVSCDTSGGSRNVVQDFEIEAHGYPGGELLEEEIVEDVIGTGKVIVPGLRFGGEPWEIITFGLRDIIPLP